MSIKQTLISILLAALSSIAFAAAGMLPALTAPELMPMLPFIYGVILLLCLYTNDGRQLILRTVLALLLNVAYELIEIFGGIFPYIFMYLRPEYGAPNMGTGLGVFIMQIYNSIAFIIVVIICASIYTAKKQTTNDHRSN